MPISIYGRNLGSDASAGANWPPIMGGICVNINATMVPHSLTSAAQIDAQPPPELTPGPYPLVVRNVDLKNSSNASNITVAKYAPAVLVDAKTKQASVYHDDASLVTQDNPAKRDDRLHLFDLGLGPVKGPKLVVGQPTPDRSPGKTDKVNVFSMIERLWNPRWMSRRAI